MSLDTSASSDTVPRSTTLRERRISNCTGNSARSIMAEVLLKGPISPLSSDRRAVYPAVAATSSAFVAAWTEDTPTGSEIRVRRIGR